MGRTVLTTILFEAGQVERIDAKARHQYVQVVP